MDTTYEFVKLRPAPTNRPTFRQATDWKVMSNETIKFALDLANLHNSSHEVEILAEIERRIDAGAWLDIDKPVTSSDNIPAWLKFFPTKQRARS